MALPGAEKSLEFFKSKAHEYVFYLLNYQGSKLAHSIGVNYQYYYDAEKTNELVAKVTKIIMDEFKETDHNIALALSNLDDLAQAIINH